MDNTRPVRANPADRAAFMLMTQRYVRILVYTVCFEWNIHTNPVHSSESCMVSAVFLKLAQKSKKNKILELEEKLIIFDETINCCTIFNRSIALYTCMCTRFFHLQKAKKTLKMAKKTPQFIKHIWPKKWDSQMLKKKKIWDSHMLNSGMLNIGYLL